MTGDRCAVVVPVRMAGQSTLAVVYSDGPDPVPLARVSQAPGVLRDDWS